MLRAVFTTFLTLWMVSNLAFWSIGHKIHLFLALAVIALVCDRLAKGRVNLAYPDKGLRRRVTVALAPRLSEQWQVK